MVVSERAVAIAILVRLFPEDESLGEFCERMLSVARDFSEIDPNSYSYLHPIYKHGNPSTKEHQTVNLA